MAHRLRRLAADAVGGEREAFLTADYNAEMIRQVERFPRVRDRAIFVGDPVDLVPDRFGPGLPSIREWTQEHYDFSGYITGFDPAPLADRAALRERLGYARDEQVCLVTVGGSGVGTALLRRVMESFPYAQQARSRPADGGRGRSADRPGQRCRRCPGIEVHAYVDGLYQHLAACDLAVVQGGLTTCMELVGQPAAVPLLPAAQPLRAELPRPAPARALRGRPAAWTYADTDPEALAAAIAEEIGRPVDYVEVETDGAARAAARIATLLEA